MKTITFRTIDNRFELTVKEEFLKRCPHPEKYNQMELLRDNDKKIFNFLHNENGPAVIRYNSKQEIEKVEYFLNGEISSKDELVLFKMFSSNE